MVILATLNSKILTVRAEISLAERISEFAEESGLSLSAAARVLLERGLDSDIDIERLGAISYNAKAAALAEWSEILTEAVDRFRESK